LTATKVLDDEVPVGYQTPAGAFGSDLVLEIPGVERVDLRGGEIVERTSDASAP